MNTSFKKDLENEIVMTLNKMLSGHNASATEEIKKTIKSSGKLLSKKFNKEIKKEEKKISKTKGKQISGKNSVVKRKGPSARAKK